MKSLKNILTSVFVILGTVIGGGLATGKELAIFFCEFGWNFYIPCLICTIVFALILICISKIKYTKANNLISFAFFIFKLVVCATMISALKNVCMQYANNIFYIVLLIVSFALLFCNFSQLSKFFNIIVPIIFIGMISVSIISFSNTQPISIQQQSNNFFLMLANGISYASFNLFLVMYVIKKCFSYCTNQENKISIAVISILFFALLFIMCFALIKNHCVLTNIPMLQLAEVINPKFKLYVIIFVILAIISTFIGVSVDLTNTLRNGINNNYIVNSLLFTACLLLSNFGLDNLINYGYKAFGIFAFIYFIYLLKKSPVKTGDKYNSLSSTSINKFFYK